MTPELPVMGGRGVVGGSGETTDMAPRVRGGGAPSPRGRRGRLSVGGRVTSRGGGGVTKGGGRRPVSRGQTGAASGLAVAILGAPVRGGGGQSSSWPQPGPARGGVALHWGLVTRSAPRLGPPGLLLVREVAGVTPGGVTAPPTVWTQPRADLGAQVSGGGGRGGQLGQPRGAGAHHGFAGDHAGWRLPDGGLVTRRQRPGEGGRLLHAWVGGALGLRLARGARGLGHRVQGRSLEDELDIVGVLAPLGQYLKQTNDNNWCGLLLLNE